jgi:hypothetical protein
MAGANDIRAGRAFVEAYLDKTKLDRGLRAVSSQLKAFGAGISSLGKRFAALGTGIVTPLLAATKSFMTIGNQLDKMAARTGMSTNALSELGFAAEQSGASIEEIEKSVRRMQKAIGAASDGPLKALQGMAPEDQFMAIAEGINSISDPTAKAAKAMEIFGRSGTMLLPMLGDIKALREEAKRLGLSIGPEQAKQAAELEDAWNRAKRSFGAIAVAIGSTLAPMLTGLADKIKDGIQVTREWISEHKPLIVTLFAAGVAAVGAGVGLIALGTTISIVGKMLAATMAITKAATAAFAFMQSAVLLLANPFVLAGVAIVALGGYLLYTSGVAGRAASYISGVFSDLMGEVTSTFSVIADSMAAGDFVSAAKVGWALVKMEWIKGTSFIGGLWEDFKGLYDEATTGLAMGMINASSWIQKIWADLINWMSQAWLKWSNSGLIEGITDKLILAAGTAMGMSGEEIANWQKTAAEDFATKRNMQGGQIAGMDAETAAKKAQIEAERKAQEEILGSDLNRRNQEREARKKAAQGDVDAARAEWEAAKKEAAKKAAAAGGGLGGPGSLDLSGLDLNASKNKGSKVVGTFFASAVAGLGTGGVQERIAKAAEATRDINKKLLAEMQRLGLEAEA